MMRHLFSPEGDAALRALVRRRPLFAFDFDGTLAPIVPRPADARVSAALSRRLSRLAATHPVAVITGRAVADVLPRLGFEPTYVIGSHGAEDPTLPTRADTVDALDAMRRRLAGAQQMLEEAGVQLEDKGSSLALHYRLARDRDAAQAAITAQLERLDPRLRCFGGKCVVNLVAADAPDKADALFALVERARCDSALFAGDDVNDEAAFERAPSHWLTLRIGRDDRASQARYFLDSPAEMAQLLARLLELLP